VQVLDQVRQDFGVGFRAEDVTPFGERGAQGVGVLDDPVVRQGNRPAAIGVRVRVDGIGNAVGGPARVGDAGPSGGERSAERLFERGDLAGGFVDLDASLVYQRQAGLVIPAVLEALEPFEE
jgi:hypothetical protein